MLCGYYKVFLEKYINYLSRNVFTMVNNVIQEISKEHIKPQGLTQKEYNQLETIKKKANVGQIQYIINDLNKYVDTRLKEGGF